LSVKRLLIGPTTRPLIDCEVSGQIGINYGILHCKRRGMLLFNYIGTAVVIKGADKLRSGTTGFNHHISLIGRCVRRNGSTMSE